MQKYLVSTGNIYIEFYCGTVGSSAGQQVRYRKTADPRPERASGRQSRRWGGRSIWVTPIQSVAGWWLGHVPRGDTWRGVTSQKICYCNLSDLSKYPYFLETVPCVTTTRAPRQYSFVFYVPSFQLIFYNSALSGAWVSKTKPFLI